MLTSGPGGRGEEGALARRQEAPFFQPVLLTPVSTWPLLGWDSWDQRRGGAQPRSHRVQTKAPKAWLVTWLL